MTEPSQLQLRFAAPVPRGHEVLYVRLSHPDAESGELLFDRTAGIAYCAERYRFLFVHPAVATDPLRLARQHGWTVEAEGVGRVVGSVVTTHTSRIEPPVQTILFVAAAPTTSPYR